MEILSGLVLNVSPAQMTGETWVVSLGGLCHRVISPLLAHKFTAYFDSRRLVNVLSRKQYTARWRVPSVDCPELAPETTVVLYLTPLVHSQTSPLSGPGLSPAPMKSLLWQQQLRTPRRRSPRSCLRVVAIDGLQKHGCSPAFGRGGEFFYQRGT